MNANRWCGFSTVQRPPASVPKVIFLQSPEFSGLYETTELLEKSYTPDSRVLETLFDSTIRYLSTHLQFP